MLLLETVHHLDCHRGLPQRLPAVDIVILHFNVTCISQLSYSGLGWTLLYSTLVLSTCAEFCLRKPGGMFSMSNRAIRARPPPST